MKQPGELAAIYSSEKDQSLTAVTTTPDLFAACLLNYSRRIQKRILGLTKSSPNGSILQRSPFFFAVKLCDNTLRFLESQKYAGIDVCWCHLCNFEISQRNVCLCLAKESINQTISGFETTANFHVFY